MAKSQQPNIAPASGFSEERHEFEARTPSILAPAIEFETAGKFTVGQGGRVLIPADVRAAIGVKEGDVLVASMADGELRLMSIPTAVKRAQTMLRCEIPDEAPSAVDGMIAERRRENAMDLE